MSATSSDYKTIRLTFEGRVARITLNRPDKLNALNPQMLEELLDALRKVAAQDGGPHRLSALFLQGEGRLFSAGVDLDTPFFMEHVTDDSIYSGTRLLNWQHQVIEAIYNLQVLTVAALNGDACGGGGLGLAMACDLRIAVSKSRFWMVPGMLDVIQDFGLSWLVQRQVGPSRALQMAVFGTKVGAEQALGWGLVNEVVKDTIGLAERMDEIRLQIDGMGVDALRMLKVVLRNGETSPLREQLAVEAVANGLNFQSREFAEKKAAYFIKSQVGRTK